MRPFHGEFTSADASALSEENSRFALYLNKGTAAKTALTLASNEQVVITDIFVLAGAALTVTLYDGANNTPAAGERILLANFSANGGCSSILHTGHACLGGTYPKVKTSGAGQIDATIRGYIQTL